MNGFITTYGLVHGLRFPPFELEGSQRSSNGRAKDDVGSSPTVAISL